MLQGVSWPSMHVEVTRWIPPLERPRFISYVYFGQPYTFSHTVFFFSSAILPQKYSHCQVIEIVVINAIFGNTRKMKQDFKLSN